MPKGGNRDDRAQQIINAIGDYRVDELAQLLLDIEEYTILDVLSQTGSFHDEGPKNEGKPPIIDITPLHVAMLIGDETEERGKKRRQIIDIIFSKIIQVLGNKSKAIEWIHSVKTCPTQDGNTITNGVECGPCSPFFLAAFTLDALPLVLEYFRDNAVELLNIIEKDTTLLVLIFQINIKTLANLREFNEDEAKAILHNLLNSELLCDVMWSVTKQRNDDIYDNQKTCDLSIVNNITEEEVTNELKREVLLLASFIKRLLVVLSTNIPNPQKRIEARKAGTLYDEWDTGIWSDREFLLLHSAQPLLKMFVIANIEEASTLLSEILSGLQPDQIADIFMYKYRYNDQGVEQCISFVHEIIIISAYRLATKIKDIEENRDLSPEQKSDAIQDVQDPTGERMLFTIFQMLPYHHRYQLITQLCTISFSPMTISHQETGEKIQLPEEECTLSPVHLALHNRMQVSLEIVAYMLESLTYLQRMELFNQKCTINNRELNILELICKYNYYPEQICSKQIMRSCWESLSLLERVNLWGLNLDRPGQKQSMGVQLIISLDNDRNNQDTREYLRAQRYADREQYTALSKNLVFNNISVFWYAIEKRMKHDVAFRQEALGVDMTYLELATAACIDDKIWCNLILNHLPNVAMKFDLIFKAFLNTGRWELMRIAMHDSKFESLIEYLDISNEEVFMVKLPFNDKHIIVAKLEGSDCVAFHHTDKAKRETAVIINGDEDKYLFSGLRQPETLLRDGFNVLLYDNRFANLDPTKFKLVTENFHSKVKNITTLFINGHGGKDQDENHIVRFTGNKNTKHHTKSISLVKAIAEIVPPGQTLYVLVTSCYSGYLPQNIKDSKENLGTPEKPRLLKEMVNIYSVVGKEPSTVLPHYRQMLEVFNIQTDINPALSYFCLQCMSALFIINYTRNTRNEREAWQPWKITIYLCTNQGYYDLNCQGNSLFLSDATQDEISAAWDKCVQIVPQPWATYVCEYIREHPQSNGKKFSVELIINLLAFEGREQIMQQISQQETISRLRTFLNNIEGYDNVRQMIRKRYVATASMIVHDKKGIVNCFGPNFETDVLGNGKLFVNQIEAQVEAQIQALGQN